MVGEPSDQRRRGRHRSVVEPGHESVEVCSQGGIRARTGWVLIAIAEQPLEGRVGVAGVVEVDVSVRRGDTVQQHRPHASLVTPQEDEDHSGSVRSAEQVHLVVPEPGQGLGDVVHRHIGRVALEVGDRGELRGAGVDVIVGKERPEQGHLATR